MNLFRHAVMIGCGNMGSALLAQWQKTDSLTRVTVVDPHADIAHSPHVSHVAHACDVAWDEVDVVILAIKPQLCDAVLPEYRQFVPKHALIASIVAGKDLAYFAGFFADQPITRIMPNLPAIVGEGMHVACKNQLLGPEQQQALTALLEATGCCLWLDEQQMDAVTAISGSGPGYMFYMMEAMVKAAVSMGLEADDAELLVAQTMKGSAAYALNSLHSLEQLRKQVTSKGGTTEAGLQVLMTEEASLSTLLAHTTKAAKERASSL